MTERINESLGRVVFSEEQIRQRVREIAADINALYAGKSLVVICVLKGAAMFFTDLVRHLTVRPELDFVRVASYGNDTSATRAISFTKDIELSLQGKHVLIVEDIVDTGRSMEFLLRQLEARRAKSVRLCALVDNHERREVEVNVDFPGFRISDGFVVGYGLDYAERYRELPEIRLLDWQDSNKE
ncbi:MAG: hypoxanthine phosphoribosyltransferase [Deltaproteobacteria bacterium]|jgi:hypoxanthine phosphoribosyltransferase|nr:hypoxanthine phosphoribosyltransferase [Deltaproteobacteria bacterium]